MSTMSSPAGLMRIRADDLSPFISLVLAKVEKPYGSKKQQIEDLQQWLEDFKWFAPEKDRVIRGKSSHASELKNGSCFYSAIYYVERKQAAWTSEIDIKDELNHLVLMASWKNFVAIHFSDSELKERFVNFIIFQAHQDTWPKPLEPANLNATFIEGPARTLWLAGIHKRRSIRADAKILMGARIQDALSPLEDQSFYFTSTRCFLRDWDQTAGISPGKSQIWVRKSQSWLDYQTMLDRIFIRLDDHYGNMVENPFPILATPTPSIKSVQCAYDMNFAYPEVSVEDALTDDKELIQALTELSYHSEFKVTGEDASPNLQAELFITPKIAGIQHPSPVKVGLVTVDFQGSSERKKWRFDFGPEEGLNFKQVGVPAQKIQQFIKNGKYLQIRYESGHTLSGGEFYLQRFRDYHFGGWVYQDFRAYDVEREKPNSIEIMGTDNSLFDWVWNSLSMDCWLYCDDRSGEVADFIRVQPGTPPIVSLIHVKGAHGGAGRRLSVSAYEVVTAQAIKNLRHFEIRNLVKEIAHTKDSECLYRIKRNGLKPKNIRQAQNFKEAFLKQLRDFGSNFNREVIVLQPHNSKSIMSGNISDNSRSQLNTLLLSAQTTCQGLGADFKVITDSN